MLSWHTVLPLITTKWLVIFTRKLSYILLLRAQNRSLF